MAAILKFAFAMILEALSHVTADQLEAVNKVVLDFLGKLLKSNTPAAVVVKGTLAAFDGSEVPTL